MNIKLPWESVSLVMQYFMFRYFKGGDACSSSEVEAPAWMSQAPSLFPAMEWKAVF